MKLDIEDNSLRELLQKRKEYIGGSWGGSVGNIIAGISLALTVYSSGFPSNWVNISLYLLSAFFTLIGAVYLWKQTGNRAYNYLNLYDDIKCLSTTESQYSLVAILNDFEGELANKVLLQFFNNGWETYMFLSFATAPDNDENNVICRVAAKLKVERSKINIRFLEEIPYQPKYSPKHRTTRMYHNKYYQVRIEQFPEHMKQSTFTVDGIKYRWMTLEEMWDNENIRKNNADVLKEFEKYIFNSKDK